MIEFSKNKYGLHICVIGLLLILSLFVMAPVLNMVLLGAMIAYGIRPIAKKLQSKIKYSSISIILAIILVVIPLILLFAYIFWEIFNFATIFFAPGNNLSSGVDISQMINNTISTLPPNIQGFLQPYVSTVDNSLKSLLGVVLKYVVNSVGTLSDIIIQLFVLFCSIYYFAKDGDNVWEYLFAFVPEEYKSFFDRTIAEVANVLKSIFYGHFLTAIIIGIMGGIGYALLGYKFALFLGILTGIFQLIPIFGPWPIYWALAIYDLVCGNIIQAVLTVLWGFVLSISDMYIRPALTSKHAKIHSLILLVGFMAGPYVFGIVGLILGPLILGITAAIIKSFKEELEVKKSNNEDI